MIVSVNGYLAFANPIMDVVCHSNGDGEFSLAVHGAHHLDYLSFGILNVFWMQLGVRRPEH